MRIGVSMPNHQRWPIGFASCFKDTEVEIILVGRAPHWEKFFNFDVRKRVSQWQELANIRWLNVDYDQIDLAKFDVLIDRLDSGFFEPKWFKQKWDVPRVIYTGWRGPRKKTLEYIEHFPSAPLVVESKSHAWQWSEATGRDVHLIHNVAGRWWEEARWVGTRARVLGVCIGAKTEKPRNNRNHKHAGIPMWLRITKGLRANLHDAYQDGFLSDRKMVNLFCRHRCFLETTMDGRDGRSFTDTVIQAMTIGMPVVAYDAPGSDYARNLGLWCSSDEDELRERVEWLLSDYVCAREVGQRNHEWAMEHFSADVAEQRWLNVIKEAMG
jgi:glycosyltransferase involved in cell wall biosynthesis